MSAVGKSTFARALTKKTGRTLTHMDTIIWEPGWNYVGDEITEETVKKISCAGKWVIEGYIVKSTRTDLFEKADKIIYLDYSFWVGAWRYIIRCWKHRADPRPELPNSPDTFSLKFLKLVWTKGEVWKLKKLFKENNWDLKIVRLRPPK